MCCARHNGDNALEKPTSSLCSFSVVLCPNVLLYEQVVRMANDLSADDGKPLLRVVAVCGRQYVLTQNYVPNKLMTESICGN
ncbi:hypothetical protein V6N13_020275 [Hibiscus sabdariffa]